MPAITKRKRGKGTGTIWLALSRLSLLLILAMMLVCVFLIGQHSFRALWPQDIEQVHLLDGEVFLGFPVSSDVSPDGLPRIQYKVGNRELYSGMDFRWIYEKDIALREHPDPAVLVERMEHGIFMGFFLSGKEKEGKENTNYDQFLRHLQEYQNHREIELEPLRQQLTDLSNNWQDAHFTTLKAEYEIKQAATETEKTRWQEKLLISQKQEEAIKLRSASVLTRFNQIKLQFDQEKAIFSTADGREVMMPLSGILAVTRSNAMSWAEKCTQFGLGIWNLLTEYPREANTEGGLFPALFGTIILVFLMAVSAFPLGVAAGIYLREYAKENFLSRAVRIAVNNLAGVPSIVYGIFGLGFFIYGMGGAIDRCFYPERLAAGINTYGGGGILWSSLTLGLLTLPVVIVATEEALATVPSELRQGSLALGATRFQTLWRVLLPMASPGILTGFILAMARAAGEVAPLMLTGAVKSAHSLPIDGIWPFVHLERKFMHLGFHIYDMGFQSPNVEASKPLVYLTAMVLLLLVFVLNFSAIRLRRHMREKYAMKGF